MKKRIIFGGILLLLSALALGGQFYSAPVRAADDTKVLHVFADGEEKMISSNASTVGDALKTSGVVLGENDKVEPSVDSPIATNDFRINVYRARPITVIDGVTTYTVLTAERTPRAIAETAGFDPDQEDGFEYNVSDDPFKGTPGTRLYIKRSKQITFELYGTSSKLQTQSLTVQDLLEEKGIELKEGDEVNVPLPTKITKGMKVSIATIDKKVKTVEEDIPFKEQQIQDADQPVSYRLVKTPGKNGRQLVTYEIIIRNGKQYKKKALKRVVLKKPVKQVAVVGAKNITFSGDFAAALARLRSCEGAYTSNTGNGYYGAYQFNVGTWQGSAPAKYKNVLPSNAPPAIQDQAARNLYVARGWQPWPACSASLGLQDKYR